MALSKVEVRVEPAQIVRHARHGIAAYSRVAQAGMLDRWISNMVQP